MVPLSGTISPCASAVKWFLLSHFCAEIWTQSYGWQNRVSQALPRDIIVKVSAALRAWRTRVSLKIEELRARRKGIGGSDAPAICGLDPFRSPMSVWLDKCGMLPLEPDDESDSPARWGHLLENPVIEEFQRRTGLLVHHRQLVAQHPQIAFMRATLDGLVYDGSVSVIPDHQPPTAAAIGVYEGKTASARSGDWREAVPDRVQIQVQHNMAVTGMPKAWIAILLMSPVIELKVFEILRDEAAIQTLISIESDFWERVQTGRPPPTDGDDSTLKALRGAYRESDPAKIVELNSTEMRLVSRRLTALRDAKAAAEAQHSAEAALMVRLGEAETARYNGHTVLTWKPQSKSLINLDRLRAEHPVLATELTVTSTIRVLNFKPLRKIDIDGLNQPNEGVDE